MNSRNHIVTIINNIESLNNKAIPALYYELYYYMYPVVRRDALRV